MVDVVANHMGSPISENQPSLLSQDSSYHKDCSIDYSSETSIEVCRIAQELPDVKTEDPAIRDLYRKWVDWLVHNFNFDGIRIDTIRHVEKDYWPGFTQAAAVYSIGEYFDGDPNKVAQYNGGMSAQLNYPIYYPMTRFYLQQGSTQDMVDMHDRISTLFPAPDAMGTFVDNHDNRRFLNIKNDGSLLKNALTYTLLSRGVPIVYYGTEQGYAGGNDPQNREDLWRSGFNTNTDLYKFIAKLNAAKRSAGGLGGNDHKHLYVADNAYAWSRADGKLVALTVNGGSGYSGRHCFYSQKPNKTWKDTFTGNSYTSDGNGQVCVNISGGQPVVLLA